MQSTDAGKVNDLGILPKPVPFGKYYLLEKVNTGGMAEVFKAKAFGVEGFERILALKRILPSIAEDEEFISMFIDEAKIAGQLNHANIAQIFDLGKVDGHYFIALEYIPGRDVRAIFDRAVKLGEKLSVAQVCYVIMKLCEGLDYAHNKRDAQGNELGIVHRDISPQNVLLSYEGECKLIDFGIAKAHGKSSSTQVGILKGKFSYMSPEQVRGGKIDRRSDIFSLGIVLYELLTLERLFLGSSDFSTLEKIRKVEFSPPTLFNPHIPQELEDIVLKGLARDPADRYQTAHEMQDALQKFMFNQGLYYTNKDLAAYAKGVFATEISLEQKKLEYYRTLKKDDLERANARNGKTSKDEGEPTWDDDEGATNVFARRGLQSKEDVLAELDDIDLPEDDVIVYAKPKAITDSDQFNAELPPPRQSVNLEPAAEKRDWDVNDVKPIATVHSRPSKSKGGLVALLIVILALGAVVVWLALKPGPKFGAVRFDIDPQVPVSIEIDGEPVSDQPQLPPLTIEQISTNSNHEYRITAEGYGEIKGSFVAEAELRPIAVNLVRAEAVAGGTGFSLTTTPTNARVTVDGVPVDGTSPYLRSSLSAGDHELIIAHEGYTTETRRIAVPENTIIQLQVGLNPSAVSLTLQSEPDGANYIIKDQTTDKEIKRGKTTDIVKDLPVDHSFEMTVYHDGFESVVKSWTPPSDRLSDTQLVKLTRKEDKLAADAIGEKPTQRDRANEHQGSTEDSEHRSRRGSSGTNQTSDRHEKPDNGSSEQRTVIVTHTKVDPPKVDPPKVDPPKVDPPKNDPPKASAPGILRINCKPPANIIINGNDHGMTPRKISLPEGKYTVKLINVEKGLNVTKDVTLKSGEVQTIVHK